MGRITDLTEAKKEELRTVSTTYGGKPIELKYPVDEIVRRMKQDARASGFKAPLFEIFSGYRSTELQKKLYAKKREEVRQALAKARVEAAKEKGQTLTLANALRKLTDKEIDVATRLAVASPGGSTHQTGAAFDLNLGFPTTFTPENVKAIEATKQYKFMKTKLAPKYKLTQYAPEPWHWECDAACQEHMLNILNSEKSANTGVVTMKSTALSQGPGVEDIELDDGEMSEDERRLLILNYEAEQRNAKIKAGFVLAATAVGIYALVSKNKK